MSKKQLPPSRGLGIAAPVVSQPITETLEKNFMPYAMSVIISRAIPEIDGLKPSQRKLLYTMYKMGLLTGPRTKSANVVGQTMRLNPHGDAAIYETMVRLTRGNESLLHPFVDSKGSFGKQYSTEMAYAASRYTEVKLDPFCAELFSGIDKEAVDLIDNYDGTMKEPTLLPTTFPNILVSPNTGIAVGMASNFCSFNLAEVCDGAIAIIGNENLDTDALLDIIKAPDFPGGATLIYDRAEMTEVYRTGRGSFRLRAKYEFDKNSGSIVITEIPYCTSIEAIQKSIADDLKEGKFKEITDIRDEIDLDGFKFTIDIRKGVEPEKLMARLYKSTPLESRFSCNFNVLINGAPVTLGVGEILREWLRFRTETVRREKAYELRKDREKLHLLLALGKILLDIDRAIKIIRETKSEREVVPNLMSGFGIDELQAEFIAEIKLRHLNREYILNRLKETDKLRADITDLEKLIDSDRRLRALIANELAKIKEKYGKSRRTQIIYGDVVDEAPAAEEIEKYTARLVLTKAGYFKKITAASLARSDSHTLKEGDEIAYEEDGENTSDLLFFTNKAQCYKSRVCDFDTTKASALGDFVAAKLKFDIDGELPILMKSVGGYEDKHNIVFIFENGKGVRVPVSAYETKNNRKKLVGAYSDASPIVAAFYEDAPFELLLKSGGKGIMINTKLIPVKTTRNSQGVALFKLKEGQTVDGAVKIAAEKTKEYARYRKTAVPAVGVSLAEQIGI